MLLMLHMLGRHAVRGPLSRLVLLVLVALL